MLKQPSPDEPISVPLSREELRHFRDLGVVSKEVLAKFDRHYVPQIFNVDNLILYLQQLLVFAPIPKPDTTPSSKQQQQQQPARSPSPEDETYFVMPALLQTLKESELEKRRMSSPVAATLLVRFPRGFRRAGVFCCFAVHLIRHCGWSIIFDSKEPIASECVSSPVHPFQLCSSIPTHTSRSMSTPLLVLQLVNMKVSCQSSSKPYSVAFLLLVKLSTTNRRSQSSPSTVLISDLHWRLLKRMSLQSLSSTQ